MISEMEGVEERKDSKAAMGVLVSLIVCFSSRYVCGGGDDPGQL